MGGPGIASANQTSGTVTAAKPAAGSDPETTATPPTSSASAPGTVPAPDVAATSDTSATAATQSATSATVADSPPPAAPDVPPVSTAETLPVTSSEPGVTATEIKIGQVVPYSGPASAYGAIGKAEAAYFRMINDAGGVRGHKIMLISLDDGYSPPKTVAQTRKLIEDENVAFVFGGVGTAPNVAVRAYLQDSGVPQLFVASGWDGWADPANHPWSIGWQPSYRIEGRIYAKHLLAHKPNAKICVLYQHDDFGKDYLAGVSEGLGAAKYGHMVVKTASYEATDPTIDSKIDELQTSGCDTLIAAATPKFAAQAIRKVFDMGWRPTFFVSNVSASNPVVLQAAGPDKAVGLITGAYLKDPDDPANARDRGIAEWRTFMTTYVPDGDQRDVNYVYGYAVAQTLVQVLKQCGNDFSRRNVMKQAANLRQFKPSVALNGIKINTSPTDFRPISQLQLARFNGKTFERFGNVIAGE